MTTPINDGWPEDPVGQLAEYMRDNNMSFVFWVCPTGCLGRVEWNDEKTDATCLVCGRKRSDAMIEQRNK